jgi:hypothetical protein
MAFQMAGSEDCREDMMEFRKQVDQESMMFQVKTAFFERISRDLPEAWQVRTEAPRNPTS